MPATIPSLWPDINVDLVPPLIILRAQATRLGQLTKGILEAEVTTVTGEDDFVVHRLDLLAPSLEDRRVRILTATHRSDYYPVVLEADCFRPKRPVGMGPGAGLGAVLGAMAAAQSSALAGVFGGTKPPWPPLDDWRPVVADQDEFLKRVGEVLRSMEVRAAIDSMIALSNQKTLPPEVGDKSANGTPNSPPTE